MPVVNDPLRAIKSYLFPTVLSGFIMLVYTDIREIKQDVKALMTQSSIDKTRIDNLERFMYKEASVGVSIQIPNPPDKDTKPLKFEQVAVLPNKKISLETDEESSE